MTMDRPIRPSTEGELILGGIKKGGQKKMITKPEKTF